MNYDEVTAAFEQEEYDSSRPPVEASQPAISPVPMQPDAWRPDATQQPDLNNPIQEYGSYKTVTHKVDDQVKEVEDFESWESRVQKESRNMYEDSVRRYNTPPTDSGFKPYVDVSEGKRATSEELEAQRNRETADSLTAMIGRLQREESTLRLKLRHNIEAQQRAKQRLEELAD